MTKPAEGHRFLLTNFSLSHHSTLRRRPFEGPVLSGQQHSGHANNHIDCTRNKDISMLQRVRWRQQGRRVLPATYDNRALTLPQRSRLAEVLTINPPLLSTLQIIF